MVIVLLVSSVTLIGNVGVGEGVMGGCIAAKLKTLTIIMILIMIVSTFLVLIAQTSKGLDNPIDQVI